jgi:hypothetical protein
MRDPFVLELASRGFVLFVTTDTNVWGGPATGFDCFTSDDLETWLSGAAFRPPAGFWADTQEPTTGVPARRTGRALDTAGSGLAGEDRRGADRQRPGALIINSCPPSRL